MKRWYAVQTQARAEDKALFHLRNQAFEAFLPRYRRRRQHARRVDEVLRPMFPGYLFVRLDAQNQSWRSINGTIGVIGLVRAGTEPLPVPQGVVEEIVGRADAHGTVPLRPHFGDPGQPVRITEGALADQVGLFQEMDGTERVVLLLKLLGRDVRVKVDAERLESVV